MAQFSDYRTNSTAGVALKVNTGFTSPYLINVVNDTTTVLFVKLYDQVKQPFSTSTPVLTIMIPANTAPTIIMNNSLKIVNALWIRVGKGVLDADTSYNHYKNVPPIIEITY